jgi:hypothetical protein
MIQVAASTHALVDDAHPWVSHEVTIKGKGQVTAYMLDPWQGPAFIPASAPSRLDHAPTARATSASPAPKATRTPAASAT